MPGTAKGASDSAGVAEVIECGAIRNNDSGQPEFEYKLKPGDLIAYMPFTDVLIPTEGFKQNALIAYTSIRAIKQKEQE